MDEISQQLRFQRIRNRVIELLDMFSSFNDIATLGAFEMINLVDDWLPVDYAKAPLVFSEKERVAIAKFMKLVATAANATKVDTWSIDWFRSSKEWGSVSSFAEQALFTFNERGRFSEKREEVFPLDCKYL